MLVAVDTFYLIKDTKMAGFGRCPSLYVIEQSSSTIQQVEERFKHMNGCVELVTEFIKQQIRNCNYVDICKTLVNSDVMKLFLSIEETTDPFQTEVFKQNFEKFVIEKTNAIKQFKDDTDSYLANIATIPDKMYQFMIQVDFTELKRSFVDFVNKMAQHIAEKVIDAFISSQQKVLAQADMIIGKFTEDINPHTIVDSQALLENIKKFDHRRQFE